MQQNGNNLKHAINYIVLFFVTLQANVDKDEKLF